MATNLDFSQVIQRAYDEANNRLRVDAEISASIIAPPGLEVSISSDDDNIAIRNTANNNELLINADGSINVNAVVSGGSGTSLADKGTFTYGTTPFAPSGGAFQDTSPTLTAGQGGVVRLTEYRAFHVNLRDNSGAVFGTAGNPFSVANVTSVVSSTATLSSLASSTSTQVVLASNSSRKGFILVNESTANCFIAFAATATTTAYTIMLNPNMTYQNEAIIYTGAISAIWSAANGSLRITELT